MVLIACPGMPGVGTAGDIACGGATETPATRAPVEGAPMRGTAEDDCAPLPGATVVVICADGPGTRGERRPPPVGGEGQAAGTVAGCMCTVGCMDREGPKLSRRRGCAAVLGPGEAGTPRGETTTPAAGGSMTTGERPPDGDRDCAPTLPE
mmetsp:Transcript_63408/g.185402  ORF Transcript_63408/g.185402 Transcript_63408/m.185402 type:complete len:151 (-) Transcript_63408:376-828(-)